MKILRVSFLMIGLILLVQSELQAGIVLKLMAVNPSKTQAQKAEVKAYLPKEIKPEHIIDKGDLEIIYDPQQGAHYVYGEYELQAGEVLEKDIEMQDIWVISEEELETLRSEAAKTAQLLEDTDFQERVNFLKQSIESKLNEIAERQKIPEPNPERHISNYRDNLKLLEAVKSDLMVGRSLLAQARPVSSGDAWNLFFAIILFLAILGLSFYFLWQRQLKVITTSTFGPEPEGEGSTAKGEKREAKKSKETKIEDIEKIINEEE